MAYRQYSLWSEGDGPDEIWLWQVFEIKKSSYVDDEEEEIESGIEKTKAETCREIRKYMKFK